VESLSHSVGSLSQSVEPTYGLAATLSRSVAPTYGLAATLSRSVAPTYGLAATLSRSVTPTYGLAAILSRSVEPIYGLAVDPSGSAPLGEPHATPPAIIATTISFARAPRCSVVFIAHLRTRRLRQAERRPHHEPRCP
jgi:hypothetical protein